MPEICWAGMLALLLYILIIIFTWQILTTKWWQSWRTSTAVLSQRVTNSLATLFIPEILSESIISLLPFHHTLLLFFILQSNTYAQSVSSLICLLWSYLKEERLTNCGYFLSMYLRISEGQFLISCNLWQSSPSSVLVCVVCSFEL